MEHGKSIDNKINIANAKHFWSYLLSIKTYIFTVLVCGLCCVGYVTIRYNYLFGLAFGLLPLGVCAALAGLQRPKVVFYALFTLNYFIMGIGRYSMGSSFPFGTLIDIIIGYMALVLIIQRIFFREYLKWKNLNNRFSLLSFVWLLYTFFQLFNPSSVTAAWASAFRGIAFYMFAVAVIAPIVINRFKDFTTIMFIWSVFTVLAVLKALIQKFVGFDFAESYWLFALGGKLTHIIDYGIRYFSFFTDAANFGAAMAMSMTVFSICALFVKLKLKVWFIFVSILAFYGMLISGTRAALAVPFVGYTILVFLSKKPKTIITFSCSILVLFVFLNYTHLCSGNVLVRRMRSALNANDPSMIVRYNNQAKLKVYMDDKPFGVGLGLGGVKALRYTPYSYVASIPTDSWYVMLWVETGIVGLVLNLLIMFYILGYGAYQVLFRLKNPLLRGLNIALIGGCSGMVVASYANEILGQFPNGIIIYTSMAMIFMSPIFDKELSETKELS
ncbi:MAG: O-antigen ligase domain-containing protein [Bacteroidales bacterium]